MKIPALGDRVPKRGNFISSFVGKSILRLMRWKIEGEIPNLPKFIAIAAPHTTNWDFVIGMATLMALGIRVHWIGKDSIFKWPVKYLWHWLGGKPVDRSQSHGVVEQSVALFHTHPEFILGLSPEGTRKNLPKWRMGFYYMARGAAVPILMAHFDFQNRVLGIGSLFYPTDNVEKDVAEMQNYYKSFTGKFRKAWQEN